jgi:serine protease
MDEEAVLARIRQNPAVESAEPLMRVSAPPEESWLADAEAPWLNRASGFVPNDPDFAKQWHLGQIHMPKAWEKSRGKGVTVAVLDTGIAYEDFEDFKQVPDLKGAKFAEGYDFVNDDKHANDDHGHGTHVTGSIAQVTHNKLGVAGVARKVQIMPLKVLGGNGSGSVAGIADAIRYAADNGAKVINMSLGGPFPSRVLKKAVDYAYKKGVTVICAAGNDGRNKVGYPAAYPGAVAVAATQYDESTTFYSNYGKDIDIAAPGGNTRVDQDGDGKPDGVLQNTIAIGDPTKNDYYAYMGTSMASPHVAGVAALVVGEGVTDPKMVEEILQSTARKPAAQTYDRDRYGAGIVDAKAAVLKARSGASGWSLGLGLLLAGAVAASMRKRGIAIKGLGYLGGVVIGASGLFFLPYLAPSLSSVPGVEMLTRGLPSWDLAAFGAGGHGNAVFFSALIPLGLLALGYGVARLRAPLAGLAIGVAAHLTLHAVVPMSELHVPSLFGLDAIWLVANAALCVALARTALRR